MTKVSSGVYRRFYISLSETVCLMYSEIKDVGAMSIKDIIHMMLKRFRNTPNNVIVLKENPDLCRVHILIYRSDWIIIKQVAEDFRVKIDIILELLINHYYLNDHKKKARIK